VSNGKYLDAIGELLEHDVVRKSSDRRSPRAPANERDPFAYDGRPFDVFDRSEHFGNEAVGNRGILLAVPSCGFAKLLTRGGLNDDPFQR
jgi:hypothetical protein